MSLDYLSLLSEQELTVLNISKPFLSLAQTRTFSDTEKVFQFSINFIVMLDYIWRNYLIVVLIY